MFKDFIQIAGIIDNDEAKMLIDCGVQYLGFPLRLPVNKEDLPEKLAAKIISDHSQHAVGILITYLDKADDIIKLAQNMGTKIIQLHGQISASELSKIKSLGSGHKIIKSLIVGKYSEKELIRTINEHSEFIDAFITDTYNPQTGATGATGLTHDWLVSKQLVKTSTKPVILAGGLNPENVYEAIVSIKPSGVDVHTGVEDSEGRKSKQKVIKFVEEARKAFHLIGDQP